MFFYRYLSFINHNGSVLFNGFVWIIIDKKRYIFCHLSLNIDIKR